MPFVLHTQPPPGPSPPSYHMEKCEIFAGARVCAAQRKNNDKQINNATARPPVQIRERNRKTVCLLLTRPTCVDCVGRERQKHERMERITRGEQEKRRRNTNER